MLGAGVEKHQIASAPTQLEALEIAARTAESGDLLVILGTDVRTSLPELRRAFGPPPKGGRDGRGAVLWG